MQSDSLCNGHGLVEPVLNGLAGPGEELLHRAGSVAGFLLQIRACGEIADDSISHRLRRQRHHHGRVVHHTDLLTVPAAVVAKRTEVSRHHTDNTMMHTFTTYYVTFQVESGDRMELTVSGSDYGMLVEGDIGKLSFQGTRYLGFQRN